MSTSVSGCRFRPKPNTHSEPTLTRKVGGLHSHDERMAASDFVWMYYSGRTRLTGTGKSDPVDWSVVWPERGTRW